MRRLVASTVPGNRSRATLQATGCTGVATSRYRRERYGAANGWYKGGFATAQPTRRRQQPVIYLVQRPPPCSRPTPKYPGRLEEDARRYERVEGSALPVTGTGRRAASREWRAKRTVVVDGGGRYRSEGYGRGGSSTGVSRTSRSGPRASSVSSSGVEELLAACLLPSFAIVSFLSVLVPLQFRLIDMYTYNI